MMNAQANDSGWPTFSGKYVEYPRFRKECWTYRQTYHGHVRDELVCRSLKERSLASHVRLLVNDIDDLREAWNTLDTCFDRPEKYISEALDPVVKFRSYKAFDNGAIREFYSILRAAMMGARKAGLLGRLINDQTLPGILAKMPPTDWRQWAVRPVWMREAYWNFVDQKWQDALNVAAAEPPAWGAGGGGKGAPQDGARREAAKGPKAGAAAVHVTGIDVK
jgi:ribulose bisphosphate carboxylase small subunit